MFVRLKKLLDFFEIIEGLSFFSDNLHLSGQKMPKINHLGDRELNSILEEKTRKTALLTISTTV